MSTAEAISLKNKNFSDLLEEISNVSDKKKQLWLEIYNNAISDREISFMMFDKLVKIVQDKSSEAAVHGKTISTFVERMEKANDQLLKLAELVADAERRENASLNSDDIFSQINS